MLLTKFLLFFMAISFLNYAKKTDTIIINEWLTLICTKRNIKIAELAIIIDLVLTVLFEALNLLPAAMGTLH